MTRLKTEPAAANRKASDPVPPEVEREVVQRFKAEHYAKWPDEALPALGGKTPRQSVQTPEGRRAVEDLLRTFENLERGESRQGGPAFDFSGLRRDLGLDL